jgi:hypothetical protein
VTLTPNVSSGSGLTRRTALRKALLVFAGVCIGLLGASAIGGSILESNPLNNRKAQSAITTLQSQTLNDEVTASSSSAASVNAKYAIKVAYFGFQTVQTTGTTEEHLTLPAPVFLQDVLYKIRQEHVVLAAMLPLMSITVNGIPASGNPQLADDSEVDLIPIYAGG